MYTLNHRVRPHPDVVDTALDDKEVVLLHLEGKQYYSLNATGARIWQYLKDGLSLPQISERLRVEFDVDADRADRSILELIDELSESRLIEISDYSESK